MSKNPSLESTARTISPKADKLFRRMTTAVAIFVSVCAAVMSFAGLRAWGLEHGVAPNLAFILPLIIDGMMLVAAIYYSYESFRGRRSVPAFITLAGGVGMSIYGNVSHGWTGSVDGIFVHAAAPIALLVSLEFALSLMRKRLTDEAIAAEAERVAEAKAQRAQERAEQRALKASVAVSAPARKPASKPVKRVQPVQRADLDEERVARVSVLIDSPDFATATEGLTNPDIAAYILNRVPGVTASEAVKGGLMAEPTDKGRTHYMRVQRAFKKAQEKMTEASPVATPAQAPQRPVQRAQAPSAPAPVSHESIAPERVLSAVGAR